MKPVTKITNLKLDELSFVDAGANSAAPVTICKRADDRLDDSPINDSKWSKGTVTFEKAEQSLDHLLIKRLERHPNESKAVATTRVLETAEGKAAYRQMLYE